MPAILIIKTSSLGDVVHNLPVINDIVAHVPAARIDWVVEEGFADIPALHPRVERVFPVATRRWRKRLYAPSTWREIGALRAQLRERRYDVVLDTQGLLKSALIARLADGPIYGQDRATVRESLAASFYQRTFAVARGRHAVVRNRDLAAQALGYASPDTAPDYGLKAPADAVLSASLPPRYAVCLHATSRDSKRWPDVDWIRIGRWLAERGVTALLPWGSPAEQAQAQEIAAGIPGACVPARLRLRQLATVLERAAVVIGVDTGLVHLAAALGRPTVAIYVDSSPLLTGLLPADPSRARSLGGDIVPRADEIEQALRQLEIE